MGIWSPPVVGATPVVGAGPNAVLTTDGQSRLNRITPQSSSILVVNASGVPVFTTDLPAGTTIGGQPIGSPAQSPYLTGPQAVSETPTGSVNGVNTVFGLTAEPVGEKILLFVNGVFQTETQDYSVDGQTITMSYAPTTGDVVRVFYISVATPQVSSEAPAGLIDGSNKIFVLAHTPSGQVMIFLNGMFQSPGIDYNLSATTVTFVSAPSAGDVVRAFYFY